MVSENPKKGYIFAPIFVPIYRAFGETHSLYCFSVISHICIFGGLGGIQEQDLGRMLGSLFMFLFDVCMFVCFLFVGGLYVWIRGFRVPNLLSCG